MSRERVENSGNLGSGAPGRIHEHGGRPGRAACGNILVADDDLFIRNSLTERLHGVGHSVTAVGDGDAAMVHLTKGSFDIAMIDYHIPGMPAGEVLARARASALSTHLILMTGDCDPQTEYRARRLSPSFLFVKPMPHADVEAVVYKIMALRSGRRQGRRRQTGDASGRLSPGGETGA